jgi:outer membrane protein
MDKFVKKISLIALILTSILRGSISAQEAVRMSLEEAINYAMKNTNGIKTSQNGVKDAELLIKENLATGLPQVSGDMSYNYYFLAPQSLLPDFITPALYGVLAGEGVKGDPQRSGNSQYIKPPAGLGTTYNKLSFVQKNSLSAGVSANQLVYSPSYNVAIRASKLARELAKVQLLAKQTEVSNQVIDAYLPALLITESLKTLDKNIENLEKLFKEVTATQKAGFIEQLDVDRLQLSLANLKSERENLDRQQGIVLNALKFTIGYTMENPIILTDDVNALLTPADEADMSSKVDASKRPEMTVLNTVESINKLQVELAKASAYPTVVGFMSLSESLQANNFFKDKINSLPTGLVGIKATVNIWDSGQRKAKIARAQLALQNMQLQKSDFERVVTLQVLNARILYTNAQKRLDSQKKNLELAERIHNTTLVKYKNGVGSSLEITTAEQQLYQSQQNVRQAQYDLMVAQKGLQKALGK